jgi:hypothetical protein
MKKYLIIISSILAGIIVLIISSVLIVKFAQDNVHYDVVFIYGESKETISVKKGSLVKEPEHEELPDLLYLGWTDEIGILWDFSNNQVTKSTVLTIKYDIGFQYATSPYNVNLLLITGLNSSNNYKKQIIPNQIHNYLVAGISENAFAGNDFIEELVIGENVTAIGSGALSNMASLKKLTLSENLTTIENRALSNNPQLREIDLNGSTNFVIENGFLCDSTKNTLYLYFGGETEINVTLPITSIRPYAFSGETIKNITLPTSVVSINFPFTFNTPSLTDININNSAYKSVSGVVYNSAIQTLYTYPSGKTIKDFVIPNTVQYIEQQAFLNNPFLETITISNLLNGINGTSRNFNFVANCINITEFKIDDNLKYFVDAGVLYEQLSPTDNVLIAYPSGKTEISYQTDGNCSVIINGAFNNTQHLEELAITKKVTTINDAFINCQSLLTFRMVSIGSKFFVRQGALYYTVSSQSGTVGIAIYPSGRLSKDFILDRDVVQINSYAFSYAKNLERFSFQSGRKIYLNRNVFAYSTNIKEIFITDSVDYIGSGTFNGWQENQTIYIQKSEIKTREVYSFDFLGNSTAKLIYNFKY